MRTAMTILGLGTILLSASSIGCGKGEVLRTPDQWRDDVAVQMAPLTEDFRDCYVKAKAGWAEHAKAMQGGKSVASQMQPKARETVLVGIQVDSFTADPPKIDVREAYDDTLPKEERTSDGTLANCVRDVVKAKLKVPPKLDTNRGYGTWRVTFVADAPADAPAITPPPKT